MIPAFEMRLIILFSSVCIGHFLFCARNAKLRTWLPRHQCDWCQRSDLFSGTTYDGTLDEHGNPLERTDMIAYSVLGCCLTSMKIDKIRNGRTSLGVLPVLDMTVP